MNGDFQISDEHRTWAAKTLNVDPQQSPAKLAELALQRLSTDDFVLWKQADVAVRVLAGTVRTLWSASDLVCLSDVTEQVYFEEVEEYCRTFFDLEPLSRMRLHAQLSKKCQQFPALALRLKQLVPGLEVKRWSAREECVTKQSRIRSNNVDDQLYELGSEVFKIFIAHPSERGEIASKLKRRWDENPQRYRNAAVIFSVDFPELTRLAPNFIQSIQTLQYSSSKWRTRVPSANRTGEIPQSVIDTSVMIGLGIIALLSLPIMFGRIYHPASNRNSSTTSKPYPPSATSVNFEDENVQKGFRVLKIIEEYQRQGEPLPAELKKLEPFPVVPAFLTQDGKKKTDISISQTLKLARFHRDLMRLGVRAPKLEDLKIPQKHTVAPLNPPMPFRNQNIELLNGLPEIFIPEDTISTEPAP